MSTFTVTPGIAQAEIDRRKNNDRLKAEAIAAGNVTPTGKPVFAYEPPADPSLLKLSGAKLATKAAAATARKVRKASPKAAPKAPATPKARKVRQPKNVEANAAFKAALESEGLAAAFKAYKAVASLNGQG